MSNKEIEKFREIVQSLIEKGYTFRDIHIEIERISKMEKLLEEAELNGWDTVSRRNLPVEFIRAHKEKLNWEDVTLYSTLSEKQIEEFADKVDWLTIFLKYNLSDRFLEKYQDKFRSSIFTEFSNREIQILKEQNNEVII